MTKGIHDRIVDWDSVRIGSDRAFADILAGSKLLSHPKNDPYNDCGRWRLSDPDTVLQSAKDLGLEPIDRYEKFIDLLKSDPDTWFYLSY